VINAYRAIAGRIRAELEELDRLADRTRDIWKQYTTSSNDYYVDAVALNLHSFYAGIERMLEIVADGIDEAKPSGSHWHEELLRQMAVEIPGIRPPVLSPQTRDRLDRYRGFRHVVRNVYSFRLDPEQIEVLVRQLPGTTEKVTRELQAFADLLEQLSQEG
jgi:hypothetical protein